MLTRLLKTGFGAIVVSSLAAAPGCGGSTDGGGAVGAVNGKSCPVNGQQTFAADGCNTCVCIDGTWKCSTTNCTTACQNGSSISDGCNTCSCTNGTWACTEKTCAVCADGATLKIDCNQCSCSNGQWLCTAMGCPSELCPAPKPPPLGVMCTMMVVYAKDPTTGTCCEYGSGCNAPTGWAAYPSLAECQGTTVCTDGQTKPAGDGCNTCSCSNGQWLCTMRACYVDSGTGVTCGGWAGNPCTADQYCAYVEGQMCGAADASATCKPRPQACDTIYAPVCGCDQKTYGNACFAAAAGTGVYSSGSCPGTTDASVL